MRFPAGPANPTEGLFGVVGLLLLTAALGPAAWTAPLLRLAGRPWTAGEVRSFLSFLLVCLLPVLRSWWRAALWPWRPCRRRRRCGTCGRATPRERRTVIREALRPPARRCCRGPPGPCCCCCGPSQVSSPLLSLCESCRFLRILVLSLFSMLPRSSCLCSRLTLYSRLTLCSRLISLLFSRLTCPCLAGAVWGTHPKLCMLLAGGQFLVAVLHLIAAEVHPSSLLSSLSSHPLSGLARAAAAGPLRAAAGSRLGSAGRAAARGASRRARRARAGPRCPGRRRCRLLARPAGPAVPRPPDAPLLEHSPQGPRHAFASGVAE